MSTREKKYYLPLESNPEVFTQLIHELGVSKSLVFNDVYSLDDPDLLAMVPKPVYALVLVFPTVSKEYNEAKKALEGDREEYKGKGEEEDVVWFKQTIGNACGLYGVLHAVSNGDARAFIQPNTPLAKFLDKAVPLPPTERAHALEDDEGIERAHHAAGTQGDSAVPERADVNVNYHYIAFVKSKKGHLYEMDGDKKGPLDLGPMLADGEDLLGEAALNAVREYIRREGGDNVHFGLVALTPRSSDS